MVRRNNRGSNRGRFEDGRGGQQLLNKPLEAINAKASTSGQGTSRDGDVATAMMCADKAPTSPKPTGRLGGKGGTPRAMGVSSRGTPTPANGSGIEVVIRPDPGSQRGGGLGRGREGQGGGGKGAPPPDLEALEAIDFNVREEQEVSPLQPLDTNNSTGKNNNSIPLPGGRGKGKGKGRGRGSNQNSSDTPNTNSGTSSPVVQVQGRGRGKIPKSSGGPASGPATPDTAKPITPQSTPARGDGGRDPISAKPKPGRDVPFSSLFAYNGNRPLLRPIVFVPSLLTPVLFLNKDDILQAPAVQACPHGRHRHLDRDGVRRKCPFTKHHKWPR